ncbi:unnamed protein product, partial [Sphagnum compactum]
MQSDEFLCSSPVLTSLPEDVASEGDSKEWLPVSYDKAYAPTGEDVGCLLRIEVKAVALADGTVLAGPIVLVTEPVLCAPRAPPKRPLVTIAGSTSGGGTRFRVVSYNILAELYATKQVDGCATFWRRSKFLLVENYAVEFNECARHAAADLGLDDSEGRRYINRLVKDNVAQIVVLEVMSRSAVRLPRQSIQVCVANTHLYSNHQRPDVKLWQAYALMRELEQFVMQRDIALILCGDLNSEPSSAVYELLMEGAIVGPRPEMDTTDNVRVLPDLANISHNLELVGKFRGTLDYICYTPARLRVMAVSGIPDAAELEAENGVGLP